MLVELEPNGQRFMTLKGGPHLKLCEAIPVRVEREAQEELDYLNTSVSPNLNSRNFNPFSNNAKSVAIFMAPEKVYYRNYFEKVRWLEFLVGQGKSLQKVAIMRSSSVDGLEISLVSLGRFSRIV